MVLSPAILWGILISECNGESAWGEPNEAENGSLHAAIAGMAIQEESRAKSNEDTERSLIEPKTCPAILWGILLSELSTLAMTNGSSIYPESEVRGINAIINLWIGAGYDCQLLMEETAANSTSKDAILNNDGELLQSSQSPKGPYIVKTAPGKGQGVFATRTVVKGERILMDKPFFIVTKPYNHRTIMEEFERMPLARRQQYMQLSCPDRPDDVHLLDVTRIFEANCFNIEHSAAIFLTATRFNHSCLSNTYYSWSDRRDEIVFHSMIDIAEGEEMTICYGRPFCSRLQRRSELRIYNFICNCPACRTETPFGKASELRRLIMKALSDQIDMFQSRLNEALLIYGLQDPLTAILQLIELIKEEGLHGELMGPYRDAADYLKGRGNFKEALKYAHLEMEEEVVCLGNDSEVVNKTIEYVEGLETELKKGVEKWKGEQLEEDEETEELDVDASNDLHTDVTEV